jgi:formyl-CoA transferase
VPRTQEIDGAIAAWLASRTIDEALDVLNAADVPVGRIYSVADMFTDPQYVARQMIQTFKWQDGRDITLPNVTPKLSETPGETRWLGPELGEHTDEVLQTLGYDADHIARLHAQQIV